MIDAHVHIERGPYTIEWLQRFVETAQSRGITELNLLEHSHRFLEFRELYESIKDYNEFQSNWLFKKLELNIGEYINLVSKAKEIKWPIKVNFGLEVCYIEGKEHVIQSIINRFNWDFTTGAIHWIDGWGFDHKPEFWECKDIDLLYKRYYELMCSLVASDMFDIVAHPDSIKCFGHTPTTALNNMYCKVADLLVKHNVKAEQSAGLKINYGHTEIGMNREMADIFKQKGVALITASDAHHPEDVGLFISELCSVL